VVQLAKSLDGSPDLSKPDLVDSVYARRQERLREQLGDDHEPSCWGAKVDRAFIAKALECGHDDPFGDERELEDDERRELERLYDVATAEIVEERTRTEFAPDSTLAREWRASRYRFRYLPIAARGQRPRPRRAACQTRSRRTRVSTIRGPPSQADDSDPHLAPDLRWLATLKAGDG
jgi:hypothetical protein